MKIKFINGPLHGMEREENDQPYYDLLDKGNGKVRRYSRGDMVYFVKEWENLDEYRKETLDNSARPGQLGEDNANPGDNARGKG